MAEFDLYPATRTVTQLLAEVHPGQLTERTPCPDYSVAALLDHLMALTRAFTVAAEKGDESTLADESPPGLARAEHLDPDWRTVLPQRLDALAAAWAEPSAWTGETSVGGVVLPGESAATVAMDEIVLHGWDLARATGQDYQPDPAAVEIVHRFTELLARPDQAQLRNAIFGPRLEVAVGASTWSQTLAGAGRNPSWLPDPV
jgi:uncharacterized protein (TIGR03086 family)